jgi:nucleotide-binding universal stress UspA family protein
MAGKILIPLDGSDYAFQVVPLAAAIAKKANMSVRLLTVVDPDDLEVTETAGEGELGPQDVTTTGRAGMDMRIGAGGTTGMVWMAPIGSPKELSKDEAAALEGAKLRARNYLFAVEKNLAHERVEADSEVGFGNAHDVIVAEAEMSGATMIAMTGRSKSFWERGVLGSTADRVISSSPMPVLVFKPMPGLAEAMTTLPDTVVVGLDGSKEAETGLKPAAEYAKGVGADLALVHILKRDSEERRKAAAAYLETMATPYGPDVVTHVGHGEPDVEIMLYAEWFPQPVIAVTSHGGRSIRRWLRGSTADKLIRFSGYPVLVVPVKGD